MLNERENSFTEKLVKETSESNLNCVIIEDNTPTKTIDFPDKSNIHTSIPAFLNKWEKSLTEQVVKEPNEFNLNYVAINHNTPIETIDSPDNSNLDNSNPALLNEVKMGLTEEHLAKEPSESNLNYVRYY